MSGFTFISEIIKIDTEEPELLDGLIIRKASAEEIASFKGVLPLNSTFNANHYEFEWKANDEGGHKGSLIEDSQNWNYYGISFNGSNSIIHDTQKILNLHTNPINGACTIGYFSIGGELATSRSNISATCEEYLSLFSKAPTVSISSDWINEFQTLWSLYNKLGEGYSFIKYAIDSYNTLKNVSEVSDLVIVGYFSIIESLIAHPRHPTESITSINHQLQYKMILLRKRFKQKADLEKFFSEANENTIWKKLYSYRSNIAHGTKPDFKKKLVILKSKKNVIDFLREITKCLIVYALEEPEFVNDLKKC